MSRRGARAPAGSGADAEGQRGRGPGGGDARAGRGIFIPHRLPGALVRGTLRARPNRFLGIVELEDGATVEAHIADRGRLEEILFPGAEVWVVPAAGATRRTAWSLVCARCPPLAGAARGPLGCLEPAGANRLVGHLLEAGAIEGLPAFTALAREVRVGHSRFDFALALAGGGRLLLEVKSVAVAAGRAALFPDAPSLRAARHCRELAALARAGEAAAIVLVAQRADVEEIRPHPVDPDFAVALAEARDAGVRLRGVAFEVGLEGFRFAGMRPVVVGDEKGHA